MKRYAILVVALLLLASGLAPGGQVAASQADRFGFRRQDPEGDFAVRQHLGRDDTRRHASAAGRLRQGGGGEAAGGKGQEAGEVTILHKVRALCWWQESKGAAAICRVLFRRGDAARRVGIEARQRRRGAKTRRREELQAGRWAFRKSPPGGGPASTEDTLFSLRLRAFAPLRSTSTAWLR